MRRGWLLARLMRRVTGGATLPDGTPLDRQLVERAVREGRGTIPSTRRGSGAR